MLFLSPWNVSFFPITGKMGTRFMCSSFNRLEDNPVDSLYYNTVPLTCFARKIYMQYFCIDNETVTIAFSPIASWIKITTFNGFWLCGHGFSWMHSLYLTNILSLSKSIELKRVFEGCTVYDWVLSCYFFRCSLGPKSLLHFELILQLNWYSVIRIVYCSTVSDITHASFLVNII